MRDQRDERPDMAGKTPKIDDSDMHGDAPGVGDHIGEAAGGISGVLTGAAIGTAAGPIGTLLGGIAGAIGGWWAGRSVAEAASRLTSDDDLYYESHYTTSPVRFADRGYADVRPAYHLGQIAGDNPDYAGREFEEIERDLQKGWSDEAKSRHGEWESVRAFAREGYSRSRGARPERKAAADAVDVRHAAAPLDSSESAWERPGDRRR